MKIKPGYKNEKIISDVLETINKHNIPVKDKTIIVAVSGGSDSMCLLDILAKLSDVLIFNIAVAHVNHSIRGEDSDVDEIFIKEYCSAKDIVFYSTKVDAKKYSKDTKRSLEESARILRYEYLEKLAFELSANIAVAHHMDDQAETILLNLVRGSGTLGMSGMSPVSGKIIRPLLLCPKQEIDEYIKKFNIPFRVDKTNMEFCAQRNKVRLKLMPELEEIFGRDVTQSICKTGILCREDELFLTSYSRNVFDQHCVDNNLLPCDIVKSSDFAVSSRLIRLLYENVRGDCKNLTYKQVNALRKLCENPTDGKKTDLCDGFCGWIQNSCIKISSKTNYKEYMSQSERRLFSNKNVSLEFKIPIDTGKFFTETQIFSKFVVNDGKLVYNAKEWYFSAELTEGAVLRYKRPGDKIRPNRNSGSKLLKDYFIDLKIPSSKRDGIVVLAKGNDIIWICGVGGVYHGKKPVDTIGKTYVKVWCD